MGDITPTELRSRRGRHSRPVSASNNSIGTGVKDFMLIILAVILLGVIVVGIYATDYLTGVLSDLETNDYAAPQERIQEYQSYFERQAEQGYVVVPSKPMLREGDLYYLWTVTPPYSSDNVVYRWKVSLETSEVTALTRAAEELDRELGFG